MPKDKKERVGLEEERIKYWLGQGAQPTTRVARILGENQIMPMPKKETILIKQFQRKTERRKKSLQMCQKRVRKKQKHLRKKKEAPKEAPKEEKKAEAPKEEKKQKHLRKKKSRST